MKKPTSLFGIQTFLLIVTFTLGAPVLLSGCKEGEFDALIESVKESAIPAQKFCESNSAPFAYALCQVSQQNLTKANSPLSLHLFWKSGKLQALNTEINAPIVDQDQSINPLYTFNNLLADLPKSSELKFATNAGMYNQEFGPIGFTVIQGKQILSLNLKEGAGNFHLMPNGVLWWNKDNQVFITESHQFDKMLQNGSASPWYATQSGPMLVIDGNIHPKFDPNSTSTKIRNGVGICEDGSIKFVTSNVPVTFYQFASLFKEDLKCNSALFLDGGIASALYAPDISYQDNKNMGVMVGLIEDHSNEKQ
ncbi:phosphodiester glycosidase family protein [Psychrobacter sp.]|uniref:phosphodiester glycosidase family protein n=1 Tax=Psychrobacter sp. TaxID=56811 RepID=UPI0025D5355F|nr:phosphodiester glycosidase family protein [Psychrobacter sp.]